MNLHGGYLGGKRHDDVHAAGRWGYSDNPLEVVVQRIKFPPNYRVAPHTHPHSEVVTVMSGSFGFGTGENFDPAKGEVVKAGSLNAIPAKQAHFVWTGNEEAIIQVQFTGPAGINFINLADDPRKK